MAASAAAAQRQHRFRATAPARRTNSLAFAKVDCHTCTELSQRCDRRRPRCGTCLASNRICGGFVQELVWSGKSASRSGPGDASSSPNALGGTKDSTTFKFVQGRPKSKRTKKSDTSGGYEALSHQWVLSPPDISEPHWVNSVVDQTSFGSSTDSYDADNIAEEANFLDVDQDFAWPGDTALVDGSDGSASSSSPEEIVRLSPTPFLRDEILQELVQAEASLTPMLYPSLAAKYKTMVELYDRDYCVIPISGECQSNPFRLEWHQVQESPFLLHAVLAMVSQHLAKLNNSEVMATDAISHWSTAITMFSSALDQPTHRGILDTMLILIIFDISQSATSSWVVHLDGARKVLDRFSALHKLFRDPKLRSQVAMLVWWDVTVALVSRREPRLPLSYLEGLLACNENKDWSFFELNGCPLEFVMSMARLAKLASIYEKTLQMEWTSFNDFPVNIEIEQLKAFCNPESLSLDDVETVAKREDLDNRQDRYHCIEAWRSAILLYAYQVFKPRQDDSNARIRGFYARYVLDNIRCMPQSNIIQKQVLLPVFLAGAEAKSEMDRSFVRQYCTYWSTTSRFFHFESASELLEDVWKHIDDMTDTDHWWGVTVGGQSANPNTPDESHSVSEVLIG